MSGSFNAAKYLDDFQARSRRRRGRWAGLVCHAVQVSIFFEARGRSFCPGSERNPARRSDNARPVDVAPEPARATPLVHVAGVVPFEHQHAAVRLLREERGGAEAADAGADDGGVDATWRNRRTRAGRSTTTRPGSASPDRSRQRAKRPSPPRAGQNPNCRRARGRRIDKGRAP